MRTETFYHSNVRILLSEKQGRGLFATGPIKEGEVITITAGKTIFTKEIPSLRYPDHAFQIETDVLLAPWDENVLEGMFLANHSCNPNAGVKEHHTLVALRDISSGEEICYDYAMTDSEPSSGSVFEMQCRCGSPNCRKLVSDRDWREENLQKKYQGFFSNYLKSRMDARL